MRITSAEMTDVIMPKEDPKWKFALGARPESVGLLIELRVENGITGHGYVSEIPHIGYPITVVKAILESLLPKLLGAEIFERRPLLSSLVKQSGGCRPATAAIEMALYDLSSRIAGMPLYRFLGGAYRKSIPVLRILSIKSPEEIAANALKLVKQGYSYLKIKIDNEDLDLDVARIKAVREAVGKDVHLTLDANQSYSPKEAVTLFQRIQSSDIDLFEQPVNVKDFDGLKYVTEHVGCMVEADESAASKQEVYRLIKERAVDSISMKVLKLGGLDNMMEISALCQAANISCRVGANVGSRLLNAYAMHFIAASPNISYACEVGEFERLLADPFEGLSVENGHLQVPEDVGIGVRLKR
ncbi:hypothetical protein SD71_09785 [Cohnella kolymensis]|uniref:Mandelate racemase/muconate lactonizing enzyme C-terminal domain-containing protein n=1 Tax=Cohnella kolymensis TaxID=1590652 RepID=A0ABR5A737_9BACL|nr:enolase C-terminal domain-like protein [Cohnella kolymensis]KIL36222.1 hypothetical protein SD71_09785 [Cohnella kolymensis]